MPGISARIRAWQGSWPDVFERTPRGSGCRGRGGRVVALLPLRPEVARSPHASSVALLVLAWLEHAVDWNRDHRRSGSGVAHAPRLKPSRAPTASSCVTRLATGNTVSTLVASPQHAREPSTHASRKTYTPVVLSSRKMVFGTNRSNWRCVAVHKSQWIVRTQNWSACRTVGFVSTVFTAAGSAAPWRMPGTPSTWSLTDAKRDSGGRVNLCRATDMHNLTYLIAQRMRPRG
jgi:hypothetical protein